ncbi:MAG: FecR family protein [Chitinophagaceae bacterium]
MDGEFHIWMLITKKLSGEATTAEEEELHDLLRKQPSWQYSYDMISKWWGSIEDKGEDADTLASWEHLKEQIPNEEYLLKAGISLEAVDDAAIVSTERRNHSWKSFAWISGVLILLCVISFYLIKGNIGKSGRYLTSSGKNTISEISTKYGSKSRVTLPDGTTVWLNSGSNLFYNNKSFGESDRVVTLSGEAFFNVTHDPERPFIIHAGKINVEVLGTSFDVKNYPDDKTVEATLIKGSIEITFLNDPDRKVLLKPDEKLTVYDDGTTQTKSINNSVAPAIKNEYKISPLTILPADSTVVETSWVQNKLAFSSESFSQLAVQMERWYNVKINFSGNRVQQYHFTGIFEDETLDQALRALQITAPFHYKVEKNEVYISNP